MAVVPFQDASVPSRPASFVPQQVDAPAAAFGALQGEALENVGAGMQRASDQLGQVALQAAQQDIERQTKQADVDLSTRLRTIVYGDGTAQNPGYASLQGDAALAAAPQVQAQIKDAQAQVLGTMQNAVARKRFAPVAASTVAQTLATVDSHVAQQRTVANVQASKARIDSATNDAAAAWNDPTALATSLAVVSNEATSIAAAHGYASDSDVTSAAVSQARAQVFSNVFKASLGADPSGVAAKGLLDKYRDQVPGTALAPIEKEVTTAANAWQTKQRGILGGQIADNLASIEATGQPVTPISDAQITAAYGPQAPRIIASLAAAKSTYNAVQSVALTSPTEDQAKIAGAAPSGAGFAFQEREQGVLEKAISQKWTAIRRDAAGYVTSVSPGTSDLLSTALADPMQMPAYAASVDQAYDKLGIPTFQRPLLPKAVAGQMVAKILSAAPEARGQAVTSLLQSYGPLKGRVMGDLVAAKLPAAYEIMAALPNAADRTTMAAAIGNGVALRNSLPSGAAKTIDDALADDENLAELRRSLAYAPDGAAKAGAITAALKPMAYALVAQGMAPDDAAAHAAASITTAKYDFWSQGAGNIARVPKGELAPVETAADDLLSSLTADHLAVPANPSKVNLTPDQLKAIALKSAQRGYWATNESDTGLVRFNDAGTPVTLANGKRLELPFSFTHEIAGAAQPTAAIPASVVPGL